MTKEKQPITAVWQNGGFSAKLNIWNSIEHCANFVHLFFDFRHFAKLQTDVQNFASLVLHIGSRLHRRCARFASHIYGFAKFLKKT